MVSLHNRTLYQTIIPYFTDVTPVATPHKIPYVVLPCGPPEISFGEVVTTARMAVLWWRLHYVCHVRLGVNFMSWSNFCVLVWLPLSWRDFITLSDIIRICGHVMDDVITLWWPRESWYDFSPSWLKFLSCCDFFFVLVSFYTLVRSTESWYYFSSHWLIFRLSAILFDLVLFHILVRSTA